MKTMCALGSSRIRSPLICCVRRCSAGNSPSSSSGAGTKPPGKGFVSTVRFALRPSEVNESNVPSAKEVAKSLPSLSELREQLPNARDLEVKYTSEAAAKSVQRKEASEVQTREERISDQSDNLADAVEGALDEMDAESNGSAPQPTAQHVSLAFRALWWGTVYAFGGFFVVVCVGMLLCGYRSVGEVLESIRQKNERELAKLKAGTAGDGEVVHYVLDISNPSQLVSTTLEIWGKVLEMADTDDTKADSAKTTAPSSTTK